MIDQQRFDELCAEMRTASGSVVDSDPLVCLLYTLARDHLPVGVLEKLIDEVTVVGERQSTVQPSYLFTNGWLAQWAMFSAARLIALEKVDL